MSKMRREFDARANTKTFLYEQVADFGFEFFDYFRWNFAREPIVEDCLPI